MTMMMMMRLWRELPEWLLLFDEENQNKRKIKKNEKRFLPFGLRELMISNVNVSHKIEISQYFVDHCVRMMKIYGLMRARFNVIYDHIIVHVILATKINGSIVRPFSGNNE